MLPLLVSTWVSAFLLFQLEPLVARAILPRFGGTPAVWTCCMLFFQLLLVAGYGYSHLVARRLSPVSQARVHTLAISLSLIALGLSSLHAGTPLLPPRESGHSDFPQLAILGALVRAVGAPYFLLATTGPLVQSWWQRAFPDRSPYRLYALSNFGSLLGLLSYPFLVEPHLGLHVQAILWCAGYLVFVVFMIVAARKSARAEIKAVAELAETSDARPGFASHLGWMLLAAIAAILLLAITNQLCQEVAAFPLLWVAPLALYLLTFILAFDAPRWSPRWLWMPLFAIATTFAIWYLRHSRQPIEGQIICWSITLFAGCMVCHGELARSKPAPKFLTGFYLATSIGGASGGIFVALIAPLIFDGYYEVQLGLAATVLAIGFTLLKDKESVLRAGPLWRTRLARPLFGLVAGALIAGLAVSLAFARNAVTLYLTRSFFGVLRVTEPFRGDPERERLMLVHGRTFHGLELTAKDGPFTPTTYYEPESGIGRAITNHAHRDRGLRLGMCGLGVGTVAAYLRSNDSLRVYEIDPNVIALSSSSGPFQFVRRARGATNVVLGDARISLEDELTSAPAGDLFDILAIDAFSGDAIPVHLLTREAMQLYLRHLAPDGVLAFHVTNAHLSLIPVVESVARSLGLEYGSVETDYEIEEGSIAWNSTWVLVARTADALAGTEASHDEDDDAEAVKHRPWTDDYSNVVSALKW